MATLVLSTVGAGFGSFFGPFGAAAGRYLGASVGGYIDQKLFGSDDVTEMSRSDNLAVTTAAEGLPIPKVYGQARLGTSLIWGMPLQERVSVEQSGGGKGSGGSQPSQTVKHYTYFASFAVAVCEGAISHFGRIWFDGQVLDQSTVVMRTYQGTPDQPVDPLIEATLGVNNTPAFRGIAYVVFEGLPVADYGNRIPQINVEVFRNLGSLGDSIKGFCIIPGSGEFVYHTRAVRRKEASGVWQAENVHQTQEESNFIASMEAMLAACPNLTSVSLIVTWFGDDLRLGTCRIRPGVERHDKETLGAEWRCAGLGREQAYLVSTIDGRPAYGGTPNDLSVIEAIQWLKNKGLKVTLYPFILMDLPSSNDLLDPYGGERQGTYPWRGLITSSPAPGLDGSPDGTEAIIRDVAQFFGEAKAEDFAPQPALSTVTFSGADNGTYRRFILHYAKLAKMAGGVDTFLIGSEMRGITRLRDGAGGYPVVDALVDLAEAVRDILGDDTALSYAADWTEYGAYRPPNTDGHVDFPLDPLWSHAAINFIGIDYYPSLADWRWQGGPDQDLGGPYDPNYIRANIEGGEGFDWYYASDEDRREGIRVPINSSGEGWVDRQKDLTSFITRYHYPQRSGVNQQATDWTPASKCFRFTEFGVGAIDLGVNRPSAFFDPKSSTASLPPFSYGQRDDYGQSIAIKTVLDYWQEAAEKAINDGRPVIVEADQTQIWAWDARPYPAFPEQSNIWSDAANWPVGHWLNGRLSAVGIDVLIGTIVRDFSGLNYLSGDIPGSVSGFVIDRPTTGRAALGQLTRLFDFSLVERGEALVGKRRQALNVDVSMHLSNLVDQDSQPMLERLRSDIDEIPGQVTLNFIRQDGDYRPAAIVAKRIDKVTAPEASIQPYFVLSIDEAQRMARDWLARLWARRETVTLAVGANQLALEPGDRLNISLDNGEALTLDIRDIEDGEMRRLETELMEASSPLFQPIFGIHQPEGSADLSLSQGPPTVVMFDMPSADLALGSLLGHFAAVSANPWPGSVIVYRSADGEVFSYHGTVTSSATQGALTTALEPGSVWLWSQGTCDVNLVSGQLAHVTSSEVLNGKNFALIGTADHGYELIQFQSATLIGEATYRLSGILRGQGGTESLAETPHAIGSHIIFIDESLYDLALTLGDFDRTIVWRFVPEGVSVNDDRAVEVHSQPQALLERSWSVVHVKARRTAEGLYFSWIRRARVGGDSWALSEVPDDGLPATYQLELLYDGLVVQTYDVLGEAFTLSADDEVNLFGEAQSALHVRLSLKRAQFGLGTVYEEILDGFEHP